MNSQSRGVEPHRRVTGCVIRLVLVCCAALGLINTYATAQATSTASIQIPTGTAYIGTPYLSGKNTLAELLPVVPEGALLCKFDNPSQNWSITQFRSGTWTRPNVTLFPYEGAVLINPGAPFTITFSGNETAAGHPWVLGGWNLVSLPHPAT